MTIKTASDYLRKFFSSTEEDTVSLDTIYNSFNRTSYDNQKNRIWLGNKLIYLKRLHLVKPIYSNNKLTAIKLTEDGKRAIGRIPQIIDSHGSVSGEIDIEKIVSAIPRLRQLHPEFEIIFEVRQKNV